jgi:D-arabinose 1-dehydrogenase-like Zn-dependent alcohol dehydrogenase
VLRSSALTILGTAGVPPPNILGEAFQQIMAQAASGKLRIETEQVPLAEIEEAWERAQRSRVVIMP